MSISPAEVFLRVFQDVSFPYLSADLPLVGEALARQESRSWIQLPLPKHPSKRPEVVASLRGILLKLDVPPQVSAFMAQSDSIVRSGNTQAFTEMTQAPGAFAIIERGDHLIWEEGGLWPIAYSTLFKQLAGILDAFAIAMAEQHRSASASVHTTLAEYPRQLPTQIHYAFASLGAWLGAPTNFQYFSYYATRPQLAKGSENQRYAKKIGYDDKAAQALDQSGIVALPASLVFPLLEAQGPLSVPILGSIPIDEVNLANPPGDLTKPKGADVGLPGFIFDKYYRAPFTARKLEDDGLFGTSSVFRDHYADFYSQIDKVALLRCKHYTVPVVEVSSIDEIHSLVARIPRRDESGLFFRGQSTFYELKRAEAVKRLLFAGSCSVEPSLVTSAARNGFDYDSLHFSLRHFVDERVFSAAAVPGTKTHAEWRKKALSPACEIDYAVMALAQHYGFPSHGLDVTLSLDVATWFAVNKFARDGTGKSAYSPLEPDHWPADSRRWPVVFACQMVTRSTRQSLHDCHELEDFGLGARRPAVQQAKFFLGGHSDHQNRLAECLVCVFRLRPGIYGTAATFDSLFPKPAHDPAYRLILEFAAVPAFRQFAEHASRFH